MLGVFQNIGSISERHERCTIQPITIETEIQSSVKVEICLIPNNVIWRKTVRLLQRLHGVFATIASKSIMP